MFSDNKIKFRGHYRLLFTLLTPLLFSLAACSEASTPNQSLFTPVRPDPTATPTLSLAAGNAPEKATPTSVVPPQVPISRYTHPDNRFSIDYPESWEFFERPDGVVFIEPGDNVGYSVFFSDVGETYNETELNQYLVNFVGQNFAQKDESFSVISPEQVTDDFIVAQFSGVDPNLGPAINEIRVSQTNTFVFTLLISAIETQWEISRQRLQALADTFTPLDTTTGPAPQGTTEPAPEEPVWLLVGPTSNEFGFVAPSDWDIVEKDERTVVVVRNDLDFRFEANLTPWDGSESGYEAAEAAALRYLAEIEATYDNLEHRPPKPFPLATTDGATIDFLFTEDETEMAGSVITTVEADELYHVVFIAPAALYEGALEWFNPMLQSFTLLDPEELIIEE